jgi:hypothetical protein
LPANQYCSTQCTQPASSRQKKDKRKKIDIIQQNLSRASFFKKKKLLSSFDLCVHF